MGDSADRRRYDDRAHRDLDDPVPIGCWDGRDPRHGRPDGRDPRSAARRYLATKFEPSQLGVQPQPVVFALFVLIMLLGGATIAWMAWKLAQPPTSEAR